MPQSKAKEQEQELRQTSGIARFKVYLKALGPGLITGASDDDPAGIGTYAQTGAQFGYTQLWLALFTLPLTIVVQEICARIGLQTGMGLAGVMRKHYARTLLYGCVLLLFGANMINIGADLGAMAASGQLLLNIPFIIWLLIIALISILLQIFLDYHRYARFLRLLTLSLFAYVLVVLAVPQDWGQVIRNTFIPSLQLNQNFLMNIVAVLGTTISPYLFFWQTSQEVEEEIDEGKTTVAQRQGVSRVELKWMRTDVTAGMFFSNAVMWFIILTTASTLFRNGITDIDSAPRAAQALQPLAGSFAALVFAAGIIGTGLLAIPILAGSAAYAVADTFRWPEGLELKFRQAPAFYTVITLATLLGAAMNFVGINPIKALYYSAILNGLAAPPLLIMIMLIGSNRKIMGRHTTGQVELIVGWMTVMVMSVAAIALLITLGSG